ncbi:sigma-E factor negative regulatory protein [Alteromonas ponticola]|uniref:Anti-sigma-E factor RseA n=1 Tax=Alteromonas ponticola TaxID=2720613 RepID=A0ABX1QXG0_9ALTE|nr:RseA family anti-sigma factor [Alteromonas ponticola]NMH58937.1 sigma-E factor negative regulatory protein [Alteromonas ponticola]
MTEQQEKLSAFMDGELNQTEIIDAIKHDPALQAKWQRYHVIRSGLRKEATVAPQLDLTARVAAALADEPTVMAPRSRWECIPLVGNVVPFAKQAGQFAVAASVAAAVIVGVQYSNQPTQTEPFSTFATVGPQGGLAPVSLEQTRTIPRDDMAVMLEKKRKINALIADHEQQVKLKQAEEQSAAAEEQQGIDN